MSSIGRARVGGCQDGASAVEFAIVSPLLFMLLFGIIQFSILFAQDLAISNGARAGARAAAVVSNDCGQVEDRAQQGSQTVSLNPADVVVTVARGSWPGGATPVCAAPGELPCDGADPGDEIFVTTTFDASLIIPLAVYDPDLELKREGTYRCEYR